MAMLVRIGQFLRIVDDNGVISITNLSMYAALFKILTAPATSLADAGMLLTTLAAYSAKKVIDNNNG